MAKVDEKKYVKSLMSEVPQFDALAPEEMALVSDYVVRKNVVAGEVLTKEGDRGDSLYYIVSGRIQISKDSNEGTQTVLARFNRGASVGEMSLIEDTPRSATATALDPAELLIMTRQGFDDLVKKHPDIGVKILKNIAKSLSTRLRYTSGRFADMFR